MQVGILEVPPESLSSYSPSVILDPGEISVLVLAKTLVNPLVLMDDETARTEARYLKINVKGTLGVLVDAVRKNYLDHHHAELMIQEIAARPDIWISEKLCETVLVSLKE